MQEQFYFLSSGCANKWFLAQIVDEDIKLVDDWIINTAMRGFKGVVRIEITKGTTPGDILEVGFPILVVSSKLLEVWREFEKFETYRVVVENKEMPFDYHGVVFLGRGGPFDPIKSKAVYFKGSDSKGKGAIIKQKGMYFDDSQWDGSNLLTIDDFPCFPVVTERVVKSMKKAKVTNCQYTPLEQVGIYK